MKFIQNSTHSNRYSLTMNLKFNPALHNGLIKFISPSWKRQSKIGFEEFYLLLLLLSLNICNFNYVLAVLILFSLNISEEALFFLILKSAQFILTFSCSNFFVIKNSLSDNFPPPTEVLLP